MRFTPLLSAVALMAISGLAPAQDQALQSEEPSNVTFGWENIMATGTEFTAEAWVRANPYCLSGDYDIFSRFDPSVTCTENKNLRLGVDGTVSVIYVGSIDIRVSSAPGAFPIDEDWHHVAFVHRADDSYGAYVDGVEVLGGTGSGYPIGFMAGLDTTVSAAGGSWQISELAVSDIDRYAGGGFTPSEVFGGDTNYILLMHFEGDVDHDDTNGFPRTMSGTISGTTHWVSGMHWTADADSDGLTDDDELAIYGTSVFDRDTDDDAISDWDEIWVWDSTTSDWVPNTACWADPLDNDTDNDGLRTGTEVGLTVGVAGDPVICIDGTNGSWQPDNDPSTTTNPCDDDSDDDGLRDGYDEDANFDGKWQPVTLGETDATNLDSDGDCIQDGTEQSLTAPMGVDTDLAIFVPDADPLTSTDPLDEDTDGGGLEDGKEDVNCNGAIDKWEECDPNDGVDDCWTLEIRQNTWFPGGPAYFDGFGLVPNDTSWNGESYVVMCYTFDGYGSTYLGLIDMTLVLAGNIKRLPDDYYVSPEPGHVAPSHNGLMTIRLNIPSSAPPGIYVFFQAVEVVNDFTSGTTRYRMSNAVDRQIY